MRSTFVERKGVVVSPSRLGSSVGLLIACLIAGGLISLCMGQDTNWDLKNYYFYNAWAYAAGRLRTDLFASGVQTYLSPLLDMPYYYLSTAWLKYHPRLLAFVMGLPFGALLFFSFQIAWTASRPYIAHRWVRLIACLAAVAFGCSGVADVVQIGTTFNEIPVAALVTAGLWLLILHGQISSDRCYNSLLPVLLSGLLFGLAAALKFTAAIDAPRAGVICLLLPGSISRRLIRAVLFSLAWTAMIAIVWAPWGAEVYRLTRDPLFPMFNNIFHSSWTAPTGWRDLHAMPTGMLQSLFYPFYWIAPSSTVLELQFSDPRYAVVYVMIVFLVLIAVAGRLSDARRSSAQRATVKDHPTSTVLVLYFIINYAIWEAEFSILRYTAALESISGVIVLIACGRLYQSPRLPRLTKHIAVAGAVLVSTASVLSSEYPSYGRIPYGKTVWSVDAPAVTSGATIILADPPIAFVAPFIAGNSPKVSFIGLPFYIDEPSFTDFKLGAKVREAIARATSLYVLTYEANIPPVQTLADFGVQIDFQSCKEISTNVSAGISLCAAHRVSSGSAVAARTFSLQPVLTSNSTAATVSMSLSTVCISGASPQIETIRYEASRPVAGVRVYIQTEPGESVLLSEGPSASSVKTGPWATGGQHVIFTDLKGHRLGDYVLQYVPCR